MSEIVFFLVYPFFRANNANANKKSEVEQNRWETSSAMIILCSTAVMPLSISQNT